MGDIVNLNQYRKKRVHAEEAKKAEENRIRFGRTGAQKENDRAATDTAIENHQGKQLEGDTDKMSAAASEPPEDSAPSIK